MRKKSNLCIQLKRGRRILQARHVLLLTRHVQAAPEHHARQSVVFVLLKTRDTMAPEHHTGQSVVFVLIKTRDKMAPEHHTAISRLCFA
jgi:hypothetical protein